MCPGTIAGPRKDGIPRIKISAQCAYGAANPMGAVYSW